MGKRVHGAQRLLRFESLIEAIHNFCVHNNNNDWIRCLACGLCWIRADEIAVNLRELSTLLAKNKTYTNRGLNLMGYVSVCPTADELSRLQSALPYLEKQVADLRQWTIRKRLPQKKGAPAAREPPGDRLDPRDCQ
jgi:hypothetical protein